MTMTILKKLGVAAALLLAADLALAAKTCALAIEGTDTMTFSVKELKVAADCTEVEVTLTHKGKLAKETMGHNWVLTRTADFQAVVNAAIVAGPAKDYLPAGDKRIIATTGMVGGGQSTSVTFPTSKLTKGGDYTFFCSFPGHSGLMKGKLILQ